MLDLKQLFFTMVATHFVFGKYYIILFFTFLGFRLLMVCILIEMQYSQFSVLMYTVYLRCIPRTRTKDNGNQKKKKMKRNKIIILSFWASITEVLEPKLSIIMGNAIRRDSMCTYTNKPTNSHRNYPNH